MGKENLVIETKALTKYYGKSRGIIDSNLKVKEGDIFGFIGPNGAGKSTTIRLLLGMIHPTSGSAEILGMDCARQTTKIMKRVGYMPSEAQFYGQLRVDQVIKLAADLHSMDCSENAKHLCERFQIDTNKKIEDLSLGNRRKISMVCAMQHEPELLILDEPTSGLDPLMQKEFFGELKERNAKGTTIFLSSHVLPEIQNYCNQAAIIKEGKIITSGNVEEIAKANGKHSAKRVTLKGIEKLPDLKGVHKLERTEEGITFLYRGDLQELLKTLSITPFTDITMTDLSLEEIFMHFYE
ncbi:MAG: ABC transporter ATP-binding protein [bacterium]|nr:ABC transporter ATP-binding protein [bacterium]